MKSLAIAPIVGLLLAIAPGLTEKAVNQAVAVELSFEIAQAPSLRGNWTPIGWGDPDNLTLLDADTEMTARFEGDRLYGFSGCNNYNASYEFAGSNLTIGPAASTRRACPIPVMDRENFYLNALNRVYAYEIDSLGRLQLMYELDGMNGVLVFAPDAMPVLW